MHETHTTKEAAASQRPLRCSFHFWPTAACLPDSKQPVVVICGALFLLVLPSLIRCAHLHSTALQDVVAGDGTTSTVEICSALLRTAIFVVSACPICLPAPSNSLCPILLCALNLQDVVAGDGTTSVVVICGALLKKAQELLERGIHPTVISDSFNTAANKACEVRGCTCGRSPRSCSSGAV